MADQGLDQAAEELQERNFTCPLPPVASSPEQTLTLQPQEEDDTSVGKQTAGSENELESESATTVHEEEEQGVDPEEEVEREIDLRTMTEEAQKKNTVSTPTPSSPTQLHPSISIVEDGEASSHFQQEEAINCLSNQEDYHQPTKSRKANRGSALSGRDKRIIEKIRSYYEAAAELEEEESGEDAGEGQDETSFRKNSFSQIPMGLVKKSVSHFDLSGHQNRDKKQTIEPTQTETDHEINPCTSLQLPENTEDHEEHVDKPIKLLHLEAKHKSLTDESPTSIQVEDSETPNESTIIRPTEVDKEIEVENGTACKEQSDGERNEAAENSKGENPQQEDGCRSTERNGISPSASSEQDVVNESGYNKKEPEEPNGNLKKSSRPLSETPPCQKSEFTWTRTKTSRNLEELPSQIKLGRGSRQSRIVTTNRALFEGMLSDITGIGLFEANPVADPSLMENSERILSKVQTLARMYSAKASTMKVPLHQKRTVFVRNKVGDLTGLCGVSTQTTSQAHWDFHNKCGTQMNKQLKYDKRSPRTTDAEPKTKSDIKNEAQRLSKTKVNSSTITDQTSSSHHQTGNMSQVLTKGQTHTKANSEKQNHMVTLEDERSLEEKITTQGESKRNDVQEMAVPSDPLVLVKDQQITTNGFSLSRPRDFISALNRDQDNRMDHRPPQVPITPDAASPTSSSSVNQAASNTHRSESSERINVYTEDSTSVNSIVHDHSSLSAHISHGNISKDGAGQYKYKQDLPAEKDKHVPEFQIPPKHSESTTQPSQDIHSVHTGSEYFVCTGRRDGEPSPAEVVLMLSSTHSLTPSQCHTLVSPKSKQPPEEPQKESGSNMLEGGTGVLAVPGPPSKQHLPGMNTIQCDLKTYSSQTGKSSQELKVTGPAFLRHQREGPSPVPSLESKPSQTQPEVPFSVCSWKPDHQGPGSPILSPTTGCCAPSQALLDVCCLAGTSPPKATPDQDTDVRRSSPAFRPSFKFTSPSPTAPNLTPRALPLSSPTPLSNKGFISADTVSQTPACFSSPPLTGRSFSKQVPSASSAFSGKSSSIEAGPSSSPTISYSLRSPTCSSPVPSSSTFTRSLAASCISQSISQNLAKKNNVRQVQTSNTLNPSSSPSLPSSHRRRCSPSPRLPSNQEGSTTPAHSYLGCTTDGNQYPRYLPSSLRSTCSSPSSTLHSLFQSSSSSSSHMRQSHHPPLSTTCAPFHQSRYHQLDSSQNVNNSNNTNLPPLTTTHFNNTSGNYDVSSGPWSASPQRMQLGNGSTSTTTTQQTNDRLSFGSHNRVARPFSASEPNSRVQSPSPCVSPASINGLCSPPPQHHYSSPMANKPPHPRGSRMGGASYHNPLGLTLEIPKISSASQSSSHFSPQILSPPPIGVSVWTCDVAVPQPRNPRVTSPSLPFSCPGQPSLPNASTPTSPPPSASLHGLTRAASPSALWVYGSSKKSHTLRRSLSNLSDRPPSPAQSRPDGLRYSWAESSQRSFGCTANYQDSFEQQGSSPTSPRSAGSSYGSSPSGLNPRGGLQSPASPRRFSPGRGSFSVPFPSEPWLDGQMLCKTYNGSDGLYASGSCTPSPQISLSQSLNSSLAVSQADWGDPELEEGNCRSQLICAYVGGPPQEQNLYSSPCVALSSPSAAHNQSQLNAPSQVHVGNVEASVPSLASSLTKVSNQKTSYATTVNLQIAGSGRITSFSTAHVSVSQPLQGGSGSGQLQIARRVSVNGLSHMSSPLPHNCSQR
ncbi:mucin-12-like [Dunckerocampus dactyliophorus]|uniref:mucin-12-like n=1 Tax=Dunckerocampus dactyliophorus TaxID=161453 RepID=UPI0024068BB8|nr:mucin-12-like [Dunckerocampus dactyliophorus]